MLTGAGAGAGIIMSEFPSLISVSLMTSDKERNPGLLGRRRVRAHVLAVPSSVREVVRLLTR